MSITINKEPLIKSYYNLVCQQAGGKHASNKDKYQAVENLFADGMRYLAHNDRTKGLSLDQIQPNMFSDSDTQSVNFAKHALEHLVATIITQKIAEIEYPKFNILSSNAVDIDTYEVSRIGLKVTGEMDIYSVGSNSAPTMNVAMQKEKHPLYAFNLAVEADERVLRAGNKCGIDLYAKYVQAAFETSEKTTDNLLMIGNDKLNVKGLLNHEEFLQIEESQNIYTLIDSRDYEAVLAVFIKLKRALYNKETNFMIQPDTLIVSPELAEQLELARSKDIQDNATNITFFDGIEKQLKVKIETSRRLSNLGGSKKERAVMARFGGTTKKESLIAYYEAEPFNISAPIRSRGNQMVSDATKSCSALNVYDDKVMAYMNITNED